MYIDTDVLVEYTASIFRDERPWSKFTLKVLEYLRFDTHTHRHAAMKNLVKEHDIEPPSVSVRTTENLKNPDSNPHTSLQRQSFRHFMIYATDIIEVSVTCV